MCAIVFNAGTFSLMCCIEIGDCLFSPGEIESAFLSTEVIEEGLVHYLSLKETWLRFHKAVSEEIGF